MSARCRAVRAAGPVGMVVVALVALVGLAAPAAAADPEFTSKFYFQRCGWVSAGVQNVHFPLVPGYRLVLEGEEEDEGELVDIRVEITVTGQTRPITFTPTGAPKAVTVPARVVVEREWVDDELVEVSFNWFAICRQTGDLVYFGERVNNYEDGEISDHEGSWRAGVNGAQPGILMPGRFLLGARYYPELAPGVALDRGENVGMGISIATEAGTFHNCVEVADSNALEPAAEPDQKIYCPYVGLVKDEDAELVERGFV